ncbi:MAG: tRNA (adenosine(37)-N6)-threonylcarbamoyltransferase complex ATPase subunit type 1 TsaE [Pseudomonadota bacterium]
MTPDAAAALWERRLKLPTEAATTAFGAALGARLKPGDVIGLAGPLGAGKSTLARAAIAAFAGVDEAPSPTFGLAHTYSATPKLAAEPSATLHHFDLYRLETPEDVWELGLEDALDGGVALIEWPARIAAFLPATTLAIDLTPTADNAGGTTRIATLRSLVSWETRLGDILSP